MSSSFSCLLVYLASVISLELERSFCECKIHGDTSSLQAVTQSIMKLQHFFGVVPNVKSIGPLARDVAKKLCRERVEGDEPEPRRAGGPDIDTLILIDRDVDLVTPMVTPLTYEGLIDELIGVRNSIIKVDRQIAGEDKDKDAAAAAAAAAAADAAAADADAAEQGQPPQMVSITLNSNDKLYAEIRDQNIEKLGPFLGQKAKEIRGEYNKFRSNKDASINEIHDFVKLIPGLKENYNSLSQHINITEEIKRTTDGAPFRSRWNTERALLEGEVCYDLLEDMIAMQEPELMVLRLLCLQSMTNGGLKGAKFDFLRREMIQVRCQSRRALFDLSMCATTNSFLRAFSVARAQTYGYEMLFTLNNLEKLGMLRRREMQWMDSGSAWSASRKNLRLINEDVNVMSPNDVAFVSSGYAPMSVRLVQYAVTPGWASVYSSTLQLLSRPAIEFTQRPEAKLLNVKEAESRMQRMEKSAASLTPAAPAAANGGKKVMVVYYIGGITFMEIAALRFLSNEPSFPFRIIICTTKLVNGDSLLRTLLHEW